MPEFVPHGYVSVRDAADRLGCKLFLSGWTSEEYKARSGLISDKEWLKIKDLAPVSDDGAPDSALLPTTIAAAAADRPAFDQARYRVC